MRWMIVALLVGCGEKATNGWDELDTEDEVEDDAGFAAGELACVEAIGDGVELPGEMRLVFDGEAFWAGYFTVEDNAYHSWVTRLACDGTELMGPVEVAYDGPFYLDLDVRGEQVGVSVRGYSGLSSFQVIDRSGAVVARRELGDEVYGGPSQIRATDDGWAVAYSATGPRLIVEQLGPLLEDGDELATYTQATDSFESVMMQREPDGDLHLFFIAIDTDYSATGYHAKVGRSSTDLGDAFFFNASHLAVSARRVVVVYDDFKGARIWEKDAGEDVPDVDIGSWEARWVTAVGEEVIYTVSTRESGSSLFGVVDAGSVEMTASEADFVAREVLSLGGQLLVVGNNADDTATTLRAFPLDDLR